jgi:hypothetical protein
MKSPATSVSLSDLARKRSLSDGGGRSSARAMAAAVASSPARRRSAANDGERRAHGRGLRRQREGVQIGAELAGAVARE